MIAHPAVTCALPATSNPAHLAENVAAMRGPLPDPDMRERMRRHMETIPGFDQIGSMPWYPDKTYYRTGVPGPGGTATPKPVVAMRPVMATRQLPVGR